MIAQDDQHAYSYTCPNCFARPGEKCTEPTEYSRKKVSYIHTSRIEELRKDIEP